MGTRSSIGIQNEDGTILAAYCHWDGYPSHNGALLLEHYNTEEKVRELLSFGNISSLGEKIGTKHDFSNPPKDETNFYGRDRDEKDQDAENFPGLFSWANGMGVAYYYLFTNGEWQYRAGRGEFQTLTQQAISESE